MTIDELTTAKTDTNFDFQIRQAELSEQIFNSYINLIKGTNKTKFLRPALETIATTGTLAAGLLYVSNLAPKQIIQYSLAAGVAHAIGKIYSIFSERVDSKLCFYKQIGSEYD